MRNQTSTVQGPMDLSVLSNEQLNVKFAKLMHWKWVNGKWWHDDLGDGPPSDYCALLSRELVEECAYHLMAHPSYANQSPPEVPSDPSGNVSRATTGVSSENLSSVSSVERDKKILGDTGSRKTKQPRRDGTG